MIWTNARSPLRHLVTGSVEPVVATVQSQSSRNPGVSGVPGQVNKAVVLVDVNIQAQHGGLGQQASRRHEETGGDARHTETAPVYTAASQDW